MKILILSGTDRVRFTTMLNQKAYADKHSYRYRFDISPYANRQNAYFHKLDAIQEALQDTDWLFWIDDDAAFTQMNRRFEDQVPELNDPSLCAVFCASPINPMGGWTTISSGNFFIRNTDAGRQLIRAAKETELSQVQEWWDTETLGMYTSGDQDALLFQIKTNPLFAEKVKILEYERFNTRPYHFTHVDDFFLVHFNSPGISKEELARQFAQQFKLNPFLLTEEAYAPYASYAGPQSIMIGGI